MQNTKSSTDNLLFNSCNMFDKYFSAGKKLNPILNRRRSSVKNDKDLNSGLNITHFPGLSCSENGNIAGNVTYYFLHYVYA